MRFQLPLRLLSRRAISTSPKTPLLITPEEYKQLPKSTTIPLDVSWHMPNSSRSAVAEYLSGPRLPSARRFDLDEVAELRPEHNPLSLTHMLPTAEKFEASCRKLGITNESHVVCYDSLGVFSSPRAVYTFKAFGHEKVSALDGGLPRWIAEGNEVETADTADVGESEYSVAAKGPDPEVVKSYEQIVENSTKAKDDSSSAIVLDHRPLARYEGSAPEPRPNLSSGHIPNSLPLPFASYLQPSNDKTPYSAYKSPSELRDVLVQAVGGEDVWGEVKEGKRDLVFTCGSGMTAGVGWLANEIVKDLEGGKGKGAIYDESWTGYASRKESKIEKGPKK